MDLSVKIQKKPNNWHITRPIHISKALCFTGICAPRMCISGSRGSGVVEGSASLGQAEMWGAGVQGPQDAGGTGEAPNGQRTIRTGWYRTLRGTLSIWLFCNYREASPERRKSIMVDTHNVATVWAAGGAEGEGGCADTCWTATQRRSGQGSRGERRCAGQADTTAR